ncbi:hypothetical protein QJS10_CPA01g02202 [Acorus calamus]|uniref:Uncharacterized protein n=1 Tax=Acorus calamus TaxID=4465 RepID=A0AAV9FI17_ACOCL|nr:hypothetical protein QJS10_CPA01g02202 [Acorus calamus]
MSEGSGWDQFLRRAEEAAQRQLEDVVRGGLIEFGGRKLLHDAEYLNHDPLHRKAKALMVLISQQNSMMVVLNRVLIGFFLEFDARPIEKDDNSSPTQPWQEQSRQRWYYAGNPFVKYKEQDKARNSFIFRHEEISPIKTVASVVAITQECITCFRPAVSSSAVLMEAMPCTRGSHKPLQSLSRCSQVSGSGG